MNKEQNVEPTFVAPAGSNAPVSSRFCPPYRVGKKQKRAVLDSRGLEVVIFPQHTPELMVLEYCMFLNNQHINQHAPFLEKLLSALNETLRLKNGC